jgi:cell division protein FtsL
MTAQAIPLRRRRSRDSSSRVHERGPRVLPLSFFVVAVVAIFFAMIFLRISLDETAFELADLEEGIAGEQSRQLDLRYDLAGLKDPQRIILEAERIGMVHPDVRRTLALDPIAGDAETLKPESPIRAMVGSAP